jgi:hypothetical protein
MQNMPPLFGFLSFRSAYSLVVLNVQFRQKASPDRSSFLGAYRVRKPESFNSSHRCVGTITVPPQTSKPSASRIDAATMEFEFVG